MGGCQGKAGGARLVTTLKGHTDDVRTASFSPDGQHILTASDDKTCRQFIVETGVQLRVISGHTSGVRSLAISKDNRYLFTGSSDPDVFQFYLPWSPSMRVFQEMEKQAATLFEVDPWRVAARVESFSSGGCAMMRVRILAIVL